MTSRPPRILPRCPDDPPYAFVLASASPARLATLRAAGLDPFVMPSGVDESSVRASTTSSLVEKLASIKAQVVASQVQGAAVVLGCDSLLEFDGQPMGKPTGIADAFARWRRMRGRTGTLFTGHELIDVPTGRVRRAAVGTEVQFADVSDEEVEAYLSTGEPQNVAGAFTVDGFGGWFIERVDGDHHNVVGVSLPLLRQMLASLDLALADFGWPVPTPRRWLDVPGQPPP